MAEFVRPRNFNYVQAISSIDGRFRGNIEEVSKYFSEEATIKGRIKLEILYLEELSKIIKQLDISSKDYKKLEKLYLEVKPSDINIVMKKDLEINHDTKAVEYYIRSKLKKLGLSYLFPWIHFGLTSADIDSNVLVLSVKSFEKEVLSIQRKNILNRFKKLIKKNKDSVFLSKTHGKYAVPTTMGKELLNFYVRLRKVDNRLKEHPFEGKLSGANGNMNSFFVTDKKVDWVNLSKRYVKNLGLEYSDCNTQILPYDNLIEYFNLSSQFDNILIDYCRDMWGYISEGYFVIQKKEREVGSSTMPHKINPIAFECTEAYMGLAVNLLTFFSKELVTNRYQRDLTDKYIAREVGTAFAYELMGYKSLIGGLGGISFDKKYSQSNLSNHWEVLTEAVQSILRYQGEDGAYEKMKKLSRGVIMNESNYHEMIKGLALEKDIELKLLALSPNEYIGISKSIIDKFKF